MEALDTLDNKLDLLLKKYTALETENRQLKDTIAAHDTHVAELHDKIASLEQDMVSVHLGKAVHDDGERENMRRQLDNVISEIDKILHTLND